MGGTATGILRDALPVRQEDGGGVDSVSCARTWREAGNGEGDASTSRRAVDEDAVWEFEGRGWGWGVMLSPSMRRKWAGNICTKRKSQLGVNKTSNIGR
jgi:hypothetical protein